MKKAVKWIRIFGYILIGLVTLGCFYLIIGIGEASNDEENVQMVGLFGKTILSDWIIVPIVMMVLTLFFQDSKTTKLLVSLFHYLKNK